MADNRLFILLGILTGPAFIFLKGWEKGVSEWIPIALVGISAYFFWTEYVHKGEVRKVSNYNLGPSQPFIPEQDWSMQIDPMTGQQRPVYRTYPPQQQMIPNQPPQWRQ